MDPVVDIIASYAMSLSYEDLPETVLARAKHLITDAVGCALGASASEPASIARAFAASVKSDRPATVMVGGLTTSPDLAAFANGCMIRYLDYNDAYTGRGVVHPSDMLAVALAAAEYAHGDGRAVILGVVLGYEILCSLADTAMRRSEDAVWDQSTYGVIGAAVVAAKLAGLPKQQMVHAISLAIASHMSMGQIRVGQISHWKGCAVGNASRNAMFCTMLAARGMTGPAHVFDGPRGFFKVTGDSFEVHPAGGKDTAFRIMTARVKPYPAGYHSQSAIEAMLQLRPQIQAVDQIKQIRLETFPAGFRVMGSDPSRWLPESRESADHSLPFVLAMALLDGDVTISQYDQERYKHADVRALMARISVQVGDESVKAWPGVPLNVVTVEFNDGRQLVARGANHIGHFSRPMTDAQQEKKFRPMAQEHAGLSTQQTDRLLQRLRTLEQVDNIGELLALTVA